MKPSFPLPLPPVPSRARSPAFAGADFRSALGMFATGVTIVTARSADGRLVGLTASSFNSVSIEPPLVLWSLSRRASSMPVFSAGSHYAINVLAADQLALAERFAKRSSGGGGGGTQSVGAGSLASADPDRWLNVAFSEGVCGAPLIEGAAAHFECFNRSRYDEGDHTIFVGEVEACHHRADAAPLLYHGGRFYTERLLES